MAAEKKKAGSTRKKDGGKPADEMKTARGKKAEAAPDAMKGAGTEKQGAGAARTKTRAGKDATAGAKGTAKARQNAPEKNAPAKTRGTAKATAEKAGTGEAKRGAKGKSAAKSSPAKAKQGTTGKKTTAAQKGSAVAKTGGEDPFALARRKSNLCAGGPWPQLAGLEKSAGEAAALYKTYGGRAGEVALSLAYAYGRITLPAGEEAATLCGRIAAVEMQHAARLGQLIGALGGDTRFAVPAGGKGEPTFFSAAMLPAATTGAAMVARALALEEKSIRAYEAALPKLRQKAAIDTVELMLADERLHVKALTALQERMEKKPRAQKAQKAGKAAPENKAKAGGKAAPNRAGAGPEGPLTAYTVYGPAMAGAKRPGAAARKGRRA